MAYCPECRQYLSPTYIMTKPMYCPKCNIKVGFIRKEYRKITRPGFFIAVMLLFNIRYTTDLQIRILVNIAILILWGCFLYRYVKYLKQAQLEKRK